MDFVGIDKMSLVDFDDYLSIVLFTDGCNFRCPFCHNGPLVTSQNNIPLNWNEIKELLKERKGKIDAIVISGGEPTLHKDLPEKIKEIKEIGYLVKLDTNGTNPEMVRYLVSNKLIDYVAMDIKNSPEKYSLTAGVPNSALEKIKETVSYLLKDNIPFEFRTTVIKEFHDKEDFINIANWIKGCPKYVLQKYTDRDQCIQHGFHEIKEEDIKSIVEEIKKTIPNTLTRGY